MTNERQETLRLIVRLAVAVMTADGRITADEIDELGELEQLGLGPVGPIAREEIERATRGPVDLHPACAALARAAPGGAAVVLSALVEIALVDHEVSRSELDVLKAVASQLGVPPVVAIHVLEPLLTRLEEVEQPAAPAPFTRPRPVEPRREAPAPPRRPERESALSALGLPPGADRQDLDRAYLDLVEQYDPAKVANLGPEFVVIAVRKLERLTAAYEAACAAVAGASAMRPGI